MDVWRVEVGHKGDQSGRNRRNTFGTVLASASALFTHLEKGHTVSHESQILFTLVTQSLYQAMDHEDLSTEL